RPAGLEPGIAVASRRRGLEPPFDEERRPIHGRRLDATLHDDWFAGRVRVTLRLPDFCPPGAAQPPRAVGALAGRRVAAASPTNAAKSASNSAGVDSVRSGWH